MDGTGRGQKSFVGYEYKEIVAEGSRLNFLLDGYESFGWEEDGRLAESAAARSTALHQRTALRMKRNRKIANKVELTRLERNFEACVDEIGKLEKAKNLFGGNVCNHSWRHWHSVHGRLCLCSDGTAAELHFVHPACCAGISGMALSAFSL